MDIEQRIKSIMSRLFELDVNQITDETSLHTVEKWDSAKHIELILALEKEFNIRFDDDEIPAMISYPIIIITIQSYIE